MRVMVTAFAPISFAAAVALMGSPLACADTPPPSGNVPTKAEAPSASVAPADKKADEDPAADTPAVVVDDNKVESLLGKDVTSAKGEKLGQVTDILVSHGGEIRAAVIDFGGFLGVGSRKIAVAWPTLRFSPKAITLGMTRDELRVTPEYHPGEPIVIVGAAAVPPRPAPGQPVPANSSATSPSPAPDK